MDIVTVVFVIALIVITWAVRKIMKPRKSKVDTDRKLNVYTADYGSKPFPKEHMR